MLVLDVCLALWNVRALAFIATQANIRAAVAGYLLLVMMTSLFLRLLVCIVCTGTVHSVRLLAMLICITLTFTMTTPPT